MRKIMKILGRVSGAFLFCANVGADTAVEPVLEPNPTIIETVSAMGDRSLVKLPRANLKGEFNDMARLFKLDELGPESRNFCVRMVYAPDRRRALYFGANHGTPHKINDVWEYDLAANTWVLLKAPDYDSERRNKKSQKLNAKAVAKDGIYLTENGNPVLAGHVYQAITYDQELKAMLFVSKHWGIGKPKDKDPSKYYGTWLWAFTPQTREWKMLFADGPSPMNSFGSSLDYIPKWKKSLWINGSNWRQPSSWAFDSGTNRWQRLPEKRGSKETRSEAVVVYAPDRNIMIATVTHKSGSAKNKHETYHYDLSTYESTTMVKGVLGKDENIPPAGDWETPFGYDLVSKMGILFDYTKSRGLRIWEYNPDKKEWNVVKVAEGSDLPVGYRRPPISYYDPVHNVFVLSYGRDIYLYRHRVGK